MTRLWHAATAALGLVALVGQTILTASEGRSLVNLFSYFTIESNILVVVTGTLLAIRPDRGGRVFGMLRLASLTGITVTGVVYATVLAGNVDMTGVEWWLDKIFHYAVPILTVVGFLVLRPRTRLDWSALGGLAFPVLWLVYTLVRAQVAEPTFLLTPTQTAPVPYGFLDAAESSAGAVAVVCVVLTAVFVALGSAAIAYSRRASD
ncbi:Pr6Pr family membrane protein [Aeromicrobium sp. 50.2.37]|uniref:Pr6Pr family membrane protein n=1 Tax=Aeromicrobium sp. 50.2.37 TaxID=2969305 RepID=UPI00215018AE|nr:Pr6Pr family membrane protein [Aeromicrobium sp. 50.2.37]MCR4512745.1 Pr6Pr family membrane protein [Aeromicrobium sp. 50.2.37]